LKITHLVFVYFEEKLGRKYIIFLFQFFTLWSSIDTSSYSRIYYQAWTGYTFLVVLYFFSPQCCGLLLSRSENSILEKEWSKYLFRKLEKFRFTIRKSEICSGIPEHMVLEISGLRKKMIDSGTFSIMQMEKNSG